MLRKDAHTFFTAPPPIEAGLDDLLRIYNQGHNQSGVPLCMPNAALKKSGMEITLFTPKKSVILCYPDEFNAWMGRS